MTGAAIMAAVDPWQVVGVLASFSTTVIVLLAVRTRVGFNLFFVADQR